MKLNLPNKLTLLRVIMVPFFVFFLLNAEKHAGFRQTALIHFILASLTDTLDGYIARSRNLVTDFGKFMDPLADKLLVCSALICFVETGELASWIVILIVAREFIISGFRLIAAEKGVVIAAGVWGKAKTVSQMLCIVVLLLDIPALSLLENALIWIMTALTVISLADYLIANRNILKD